MYFVEKIGEEWKILGSAYIHADEDKVSFKDYTVKVPDSKVSNQYGGKCYFVDVDEDRGVVLAGEDTDQVESLGGGITDSILSNEIMKRLNEYLGDMKPNSFWLGVGILIGSFVGFGALRLIHVLPELLP